MINQPEGASRVYDPGEFSQLFAWEVRRATRYQDFLSLCLLRPNHAGPPRPGFLNAMARRVVELLRSTDLVGMVDDTIAVLLVHTPYSDATSIVERLRSQVESQAFDVMSCEPLMATLSLGLAEFPTDATSEEVLFAHARARLTEVWEAQRRSSGAS
jgi:hypothetical protein